jgi:cobalt/nickel transport system permease protein
MHMADALISPAVGGTLWIVSGGLIAFCARKVKQSLRDNLVPMMGVLGAFIFAAQMINFSIPGTGSSGHLGGGLILTVLLGPYAAFLVISSVLTVQAFFFRRSLRIPSYTGPLSKVNTARRAPGWARSSPPL